MKVEDITAFREAIHQEVNISKPRESPKIDSNTSKNKVCSLNLWET